MGAIETELQSGANEPSRIVSQEAALRFGEWGIPPDYIAMLDDLLSHYDYGNCVKKVERIAQMGGFIGSANRQKQLLFPHFYDIHGRTDGTCGDLALRLVQAGDMQSWLSDVNAYLKDQGKAVLQIAYVSGSSRTHYVAALGAHTFVGLIPEDKDLDELIVLDPAFQEVSTLDENGYGVNEEGLFLDPEEISTPLTGKLDLGIYNSQNGQIQGNHSLTIGISSDRTHTYGISACMDRKSFQMLYLIMRVDADGRRTNYYINPYTQQLIGLGDGASNISKTQQREIIAMLKALGTMPIRRDLENFPYPLTKDLKDAETMYVSLKE